MFLKNVNSIKTRLTFFYTLTTFILISLVALFLFSEVVHMLHSANYRFLSNEVDILTNILKNKPDNKDILEQKVIEVPFTKTGSDYHYFIRIVNDKNAHFIETPNMDDVFNAAKFFNNNDTLQEKEIDRWIAPDKSKYLLIRSPAINGKSGAMWQIQIALDISYQQAMLAKTASILLVILLVAAFLSILVGYVIAHKGMKSLYEMTAAAETITASSLHQKIDPDLWPTELKKLGRAFNRMLDRIETSFSKLVEFSADLAHELRTPINNLMGQTEIVLSNPASVDNYQNILASNLEELQRISQIIENLLFLARTENMQFEIEKTTFQVENEIKLICEFYQALAEEKNIRLNYTGDAIISANTIMFRRLLNNLISNAINYTPQDGSVDIVIEKQNNSVKISVNDTGIGIAPENLGKVFTRFYRVDAARSHGGTGLGLPIAKSIIELHRGSIAINSEPGLGSCVTILMPA